MNQDFSKGYIAGQRKLCEAILMMEIKTVADYQWLLTHLKEVRGGREILSNTAIGFEPSPQDKTVGLGE